jgi:hypothetical protein
MSGRIYFGHCIGCDQPIRPPYITFAVKRAHGDGNSITEWEDADVCSECAGKITVEGLYDLVSAEEEETTDA